MKESTYDKIILDDHPVLYLPLNETSGTIAHDLSGYGNDGAIQGGVTLGQPGPFFSGDTTMEFNGSSGLVAVPDASSLNPATGLTMEAWANPASIPTAGNYFAIFEKEEGIGQRINGAYYFSFDSNAKLAIYLEGPAIPGYMESTIAIKTNVWAYLSATWDGDTLRLYINGNPAGSYTVPGAIARRVGQLSVGYGDPGNARWFPGFIAKVAVYNYALTPQRIAYHYKAALTHL